MKTWSCRQICLFVFVLAFTVRVGLIMATRSYTDPERDEVVRIAESLSTNGTFAEAYCDGCGPTAHTAPLYPLLLSVIFRTFGLGVAGTFAMEVFSSLLASLQYALVPYVAAICGMPRLAGLLGGVLAALLPINRWVQTKGNFEYALAGLLCVVITATVIPTWRSRDFSARRGVMLGFLWGVTLLTAPQFVSLLVVILAYPYVTMPAARSRYWIFVGCHAVIIAVLLAPWTIRNFQVLGAPIWSRSNLGFELNLSNNEEASAIWQDNMDRGVFRRLHPFVSPEQLRRLKEIGEVAYNKERMMDARQWIVSHPVRFVWLTAQRVAYFWFPPLRRPSQTIALSIITALGLLGFFFYLWHRGVGWQYFTLLWAVFPIASYLFQQSSRMRYPIEWTSFLFAGFWLALVMEKRFKKPGTQ